MNRSWQLGGVMQQRGNRVVFIATMFDHKSGYTQQMRDIGDWMCPCVSARDEADGHIGKLRQSAS